MSFKKIFISSIRGKQCVYWIWEISVMCQWRTTNLCNSFKCLFHWSKFTQACTHTLAETGERNAH